MLCRFPSVTFSRSPSASATLILPAAAPAPPSALFAVFSQGSSPEPLVVYFASKASDIEEQKKAPALAKAFLEVRSGTWNSFFDELKNHLTLFRPWVAHRCSGTQRQWSDQSDWRCNVN
jgi:hypothetical protein